MKRTVQLILVMILILIWIPVCEAAVAPVSMKNISVKISTGVKQGKVIYVNLKDWEIRPVLAKGTVGATESLTSMAKRTGAIAAINGTFFNSYSDMQPHGVLEVEGNFYHTGNNGSTLGITNDNKIQIENLFMGIEGSINGSYEWPNKWYAWGLNHRYADQNALMVFTPAIKSKVGSNISTSIVVINGTVSKITKGPLTIPANGFVIVANNGSAAQTVAKMFKVGDRVGYRLTYKLGSKNGTSIDWSTVRHSLGAGPRLLTNGKISLDFKKEGMTDPKLTTYRSIRSFIGVDKSGLLVIGTVHNSTVKELAEVAKNLNLLNAMNLDGGASSGLYYQGTTVTNPGRLLSNSLVVIRRTTPPVRQPSKNELALNYYTEGKVLENTGNITGAKEKYLKALEIDNTLTDAHLKLANIFYKEPNYNLALVHFESYIQLNPKNPAPYESIAWIYYSRKEYYQSIQAFQKLAAVDSNSKAKAYYSIGLCYSAWQVKEYDKAREYFQLAIQVDPDGTMGNLSRERIKSLPG